MALGVGEINATLAVTHRLADRVNRWLAEKVDRHMWALTIVNDYRDLHPRRFADPRQQISLVGFARASTTPSS